MDESLARLRDPSATATLADTLCQLIKDIRRIIMHPDLQNHAKLSAIERAVDELAPPPDILLPPGAGEAMDGFLLPRRTT